MRAVVVVCLAVALCAGFSSAAVVEVFPDNDATISFNGFGGDADFYAFGGLANGAAPVVCLNPWAPHTPLFHFPLAETFQDGQDIVSVDFTVTLLRSGEDFGGDPQDSDRELQVHRILAGAWDEGPNYCRRDDTGDPQEGDYGWCRGDLAHPGSVTRAERVWGDPSTTWQQLSDLAYGIPSLGSSDGGNGYDNDEDGDGDENNAVAYSERAGFNGYDFAREPSATGNLGVNDGSQMLYYIPSQGESAWPVVLTGSTLVDDVRDMIADPETNFGWAMQHTPGFGNALVFASRQYNSADSADCAIRPKLTITYEGSAATPPEVNYKSPLPVGILHGPDEEPIGEQAVVEDTVTVIASQDAHLKGDSANGEAPVLCFTSFYETPRTALLKFDLDEIQQQVEAGNDILDAYIELNLVRANDETDRRDFGTRFSAHRVLAGDWNEGADMYRKTVEDFAEDEDADGLPESWNYVSGYCAGGEPSDGAVTGVNRIHDATSPTPWDMRLDGYNDIDFRRSPSAWGDPGLGDMYGDNVNFCDECLLDHPFAIRGDGLVEDILDMIANGGNYGWAVAVRALDEPNIDSFVVASSEFVPPGGRRLGQGDEWRDLGATTCGVTREVKVCGHHDDYGSAEQQWWNPMDYAAAEASSPASSWIDPTFDGESRPRLVVKFGNLPGSGDEGNPCDSTDDCNEGLTCLGGEGICSALIAECSAMPLADVFVMQTNGKKYMVTTESPGVDVDPLVTINGVDYFDVGGSDSGLRQSTCEPSYDDIYGDDDYTVVADDDYAAENYDDDNYDDDDGEGGDDFNYDDDDDDDNDDDWFPDFDP